MEREEIKKRIFEYLKSHRKLTLATVTSEGKPLAHTVEYVSDDTDVYFATKKDTAKIKNILKNPNVAYTVDEDYDDWMKIQGVEMLGKATVLSEKEVMEKVMDIYIKKFPFAVNFLPNPEIVFIKIKPLEGFFLDYTKRFLHKDKVIF